ncbi:MAG: hypothetical protein JHC31_15025 [Sulfurihydrogenibium sp.]|jgi:hypothetical protein|nr:hypothetical protein [Sulfurihydrogenibium sp.]
MIYCRLGIHSSFLKKIFENAINELMININNYEGLVLSDGIKNYKIPAIPIIFRRDITIEIKENEKIKKIQEYITNTTKTIINLSLRKVKDKLMLEIDNIEIEL